MPIARGLCPHDTEANPATSLLQRVKEIAARLSPNKNRLVPSVQQFRRTLKGATAFTTTTGVGIRGVVNGVASALVATKLGSRPGIAGSVIHSRSRQDDGELKTFRAEHAPPVCGRWNILGDRVKGEK